MMRRLLRGSSSQSSKEKAPKPKYNLPRTAEVQACEWPSDDFLRAAGIYEDFHELAHNAGLTAFLHDQCDQYLLLTNTFVQNFHFHSRNSPPTVEFHLYDEHTTGISYFAICDGGRQRHEQRMAKGSGKVGYGKQLLCRLLLGGGRQRERTAIIALSVR